MKLTFQDIVATIQAASGFASMASGNPLFAVFGELAARLYRVAVRAYQSGKERGEWDAEQEKQWDEQIFPSITNQPHWKP